MYVYIYINIYIYTYIYMYIYIHIYTLSSFYLLEELPSIYLFPPLPSRQRKQQQKMLTLHQREDNML